MIIIKKGSEIEKMRASGKILKEVMHKLIEQVEVGITTESLDALAYKLIIGFGARPSFLNYHGFPSTICASINEEVVHGIPNKRVLSNGDILSLDIGVIFEGFHSDMAVTVPVGNIDEQSRSLIETTRLALFEGINRCKANNRLGDIGYAIEKFVKKFGFEVVREYVGHGIGRDLHEDPQVPNFGNLNIGPKLIEGMTLALEPMVNAGTWKTQVLKDNWTVITQDKKRSAHFEHTILITAGEPEILTN